MDSITPPPICTIAYSNESTTFADPVAGSALGASWTHAPEWHRVRPSSVRLGCRAAGDGSAFADLLARLVDKQEAVAEDLYQHILRGVALALGDGDQLAVRALLE